MIQGRPDSSAADLQGVNDYWQALDADQIRRGEHREFIGGLWDDLGPWQLHLLRARGLLPSSRLLDVGCGALRGGLHFIRYLQPGHYCGVDANASLIEAGRHELAAANLSDRDAQLRVDHQFDVAGFGPPFEFALAVSLFTHLPFTHIQHCLSQVAPVLASNGVFYATFFEAPISSHRDALTHSPGGVVSQYGRDPFHQSFEELAGLGNGAGLQATYVGDVGHARGQRLIAFQHR